MGVGTNSPQSVLEIVGNPTYQSPVIDAEVSYSGTHDVAGIRSVSQPTQGYGIGVFALGGKDGIRGISDGEAFTGAGRGVLGSATGSAGSRYGVLGEAVNPGGNIAAGTYGQAEGATTNYGVYGRATGGTFNYAGYFGDGDVYVENNIGIGTFTATSQLHVAGNSTSTASVTDISVGYTGNQHIRALEVNSTPADGYGYGVYTTGGQAAVHATNPGGSYMGTSRAIHGYSTGTSGVRIGTYGGASNSGGNQSFGIFGFAEDATNNYGVYGTASGGTNNYAGYFNNGIVYVKSNIGIGTLDPSQQLHIQGNVRVTGRYYDSNNDSGSIGQVLSSTGSGTDWVTPSGSIGPTGPTGATGADGATGVTGATGPLVTGISKQTLRHNGSDWVADSELVNDGTNIGIGEYNPTQKLHVKGNMRLTQALYDRNNLPGNAGEILLSTGTGVEWTTFNPGGGGASWKIFDDDGDTKVDTEESFDEDIIRFDMGGNEFFTMVNGRLNVLNTGNSVFLGENAGLSDDLTSNENTFIGYRAGQNSATGFRNVAIGKDALRSNTTAGTNTAIGEGAMEFSDNDGTNSIAVGVETLNRNSNSDNVAIGNFAISNTGTHNGWRNTTVGTRSMEHNVGGDYNAALGYRAFNENQNGDANASFGAFAMEKMFPTSGQSFNVALGYEAMRGSNTISSNIATRNTAVGATSLKNVSSGSNNAAVGYGSMEANITGANNVALGYYSLNANTTGTANVAVGSSALRMTTGNFNTATGFDALRNNNIGQRNSAVGHSALKNNTTGDNNTAVGIFALESNTTADNNTAIGYSANSNSGNHTNSTGLGYDAEPGASNTVRIGNSAVSTIGGYANWSNVSDGRFKINVQENVAGLNFIMKLRPVTYHLDLNALSKFSGTPDSMRLFEAEHLKSQELQVGFIAQEVEQAADELNFDFHGIDKPKNDDSHYGLRYAEFVPSLVKAIQEQQQIINHLEAEIETLREKNQRISELEERMLQLEGQLSE